MVGSTIKKTMFLSHGRQMRVLFAHFTQRLQGLDVCQKSVLFAEETMLSGTEAPGDGQLAVYTLFSETLDREMALSVAYRTNEFCLVGADFSAVLVWQSRVFGFCCCWVFVLLLLMFANLCVCVRTPQCMFCSEDKLCESVLSVHHVGCGN